MALNKKSLELPLINGLDTKTDDKQVKVGKLLSAQNCEFRKPGKIMKRNGFNNLNNVIADNGNEIVDGQAIMTYNKELLAFDKSNVYSYIGGLSQWKDKGDFQSIYLRSNTVTNGTLRDYMNDNALLDGLECYVFLRDDGTTSTMYYQVNDIATKQIVVGPVAVSTTALSPRVTPTSNGFLIAYYNLADGRLYKGVLPVANITSTIAFNFFTDNSANINSVDPQFPVYDILCWTAPDASFTDRVYVAYNNYNIVGDTTIAYYDDPYTTIAANQIVISTDTMLSATLVTNDANFLLGGNPLIGLGCTLKNGADTIQFVGWSDDLVVEQWNVNLIVKSSPLSVSARQLSIKSLPDASNELFFIAVDYVFDTAQMHTMALTYDVFNSTSEYLFDIQQTAIAADAFIYNSRGYVPVVAAANLITYDVTSTSTYFLINDVGEAIGRWNMNTAAGLNYVAFDVGFGVPIAVVWRPHTDTLSTTEFITGLRNVTSFPSVSGQLQTGLFSPLFDFFEPERSYSRAEIASSLYVGGGMLFQYDGQNLVEDGFNWNPVLQNVSTSAPGTSYEYQYCVVWEWVDNIGNVHRSSPSNVITINTSAPIGAGATATDISIYPLSLTYKTAANSRTPVVGVVYRTKEDNADVFYRLPVTSANQNSTTSTYITPANDNTLDANITVPLYTTGNVLGNDAPPPVGAMVVYRDRLFVLDSTNPLVIYYSKKVNFASAVDFSDGQLINVDPTGGPVTGLSAMDDKLLIFKEDSIRYISGQGPNPDGTNDDYGSTTLITTDAGCVNSRSIVTTPDGVMFKSSKGIYFIDRGLKVSYLGAPVEKFNSDFITSAVLMSDNNQIRFTLDTNVILVYDYFIDTWATFTPLTAVDSVVWDDAHTFINSNGRVQKQDNTIWTDNGTGYQMELTTGWLTFGGIQGFQRLYKITLLGNYNSSHNLQCNLYYDFNNAITQTITVEPQVPSVYGSGEYGEESPYGGEFDLYQYELYNARQKCMSVKMQIRDTAVEGETLGRGYELSNMRLSYGVIGGSNRIRAAQGFGN